MIYLEPSRSHVRPAERREQIGDADPRRDAPGAGRCLAGLIPGAKLAVLSSAGHIPAIEAGQEFDAALLGFLREAMPLRKMYVPDIDIADPRR